MTTFKLAPNFTKEEAACKCGRPSCDAPLPPDHMLRRLQRARDTYGKPMEVNSWSRCQEHNDFIGGARKSYHLTAEAIDVECLDSGDRGDMVFAFLEAGMSVKVYGRWVHADVRPGRRRVIL